MPGWTADRDVHRKQHYTAKRVFDRLREAHGFTGGYTIIKGYIRERERRGREMFVPLAHPPGHAQADFGEAIVVTGGVEQKAHFFVMDLPHSDGCFVRAYPAATAAAWMDGHVHACAFFGGVPLSVLYDSEEDQETIRGIVSLTNRCLVSKILPDGTRKRATLFSALQSHYLFRDRYGRPGKGNDKSLPRTPIRGQRRGARWLRPTELHGADPPLCQLGGVQRLPRSPVPQAPERYPARPQGNDRRSAASRSGRDEAAARGAVRGLRPDQRQGQFAVARALQEFERKEIDPVDRF